MATTLFLLFMWLFIISAVFFDLHILPRVVSHFKIVTKGATIVQLTDDSFV